MSVQTIHTEVCLAVNVASDAYGRVSADDIFSVIQAYEVPYAFASPFYAVVQFFDLSSSEYLVSLVPGSTGIQFKFQALPVIVPTGTSYAICVLTVADCLVQSFGDHELAVWIDGNTYPVSAILRVVRPVTSEGLGSGSGLVGP